MPDHKYSAIAIALLATIRPADSGKKTGNITLGAQTLIGFKGHAKGFGSLLAAHGRADEDAQCSWSIFAQPFGHLLRLFFAACGEIALEIRKTFFGFGMAP